MSENWILQSQTFLKDQFHRFVSFQIICINLHLVSVLIVLISFDQFWSVWSVLIRFDHFGVPFSIFFIIQNHLKSLRIISNHCLSFLFIQDHSPYFRIDFLLFGVLGIMLLFFYNSWLLKWHFIKNTYNIIEYQSSLDSFQNRKNGWKDRGSHFRGVSRRFAPCELQNCANFHKFDIYRHAYGKKYAYGMGLSENQRILSWKTWLRISSKFVIFEVFGLEQRQYKNDSG